MYSVNLMINRPHSMTSCTKQYVPAVAGVIINTDVLFLAFNDMSTYTRY